MIENLIVNGASFTEGNSWAKSVADYFKVPTYQNLATRGAGNFYICNSTQEYLANQKFVPEKTMVLIMWTGTGAKDIRLAGDWWYHLQNTYKFGCKTLGIKQDEGDYYLFSAGLTNSWTNHSLTKKIFNWHYKLSDPATICKETLMQFINLENFLKVNNYNYRFIGHANYWNSVIESGHDGNYLLGYFCKDWPIYQTIDLQNWIFINQQQDSLYEFAGAINQLDCTKHPTQLAHRLYADQVVIPNLSIIVS